MTTAAALPGPGLALVMLLLAQGLYAAAISPWFAPAPAAAVTRWWTRALAPLLALGLYAAWVVLVIGTPAQWLRADDSPLHALLLSGGFLLALLAALRLWPLFGFCLQVDATQADEAGVGSLLRHWRRQFERAWQQTGAPEEDDFGRGVAVAIGLLVVVIPALLIAGVGAWLAPSWRLPLAVGYALLLCPGAHALMLWQSRHPYAPTQVPVQTPALAVTASEPEQASLLGVMPKSAATAEGPAQIAPDRNSTLLNAAASGNVAQALELLRAGADPNSTPGLNDRDQRSAMMSAVTLSDLRLLRELIARGGDPNRAVNGMTPLLIAVRDTLSGRPDAVMTLLANGADSKGVGPDGNTALHHAATTADPTTVAMLLDAGAPIDAVNGEGLSALGVAARAGNEPVVKLLLERGARTEPTRGLSALIAAASAVADAPALTRRLLKARADVRAVDKLGRTALHVAALHGHAEMVESLLTAGAAIDARDAQGVTALMEAARAGANRVLKRLVFRKPDVGCLDHAGRSALHIACQSKNADCETLRALLGIGADPALTNRDGKRAVELAAQAGRWPMVAVLDPAWPLPDAVVPAESGDAHSADTSAVHEGERLRLLGESLLQGRLLIAGELLGLEPALAGRQLQALLPACFGSDSAEAVRLLSAFGLDLDALPESPLLAAIRFSPLPLAAIEALLTAGAVPGGGALLPLLIGGACETDPERRRRIETIALDLLARGADPFASDGQGAGLLHHAASAPWPRLLARGLAIGLDPNQRDRRGCTPLLSAVASRDREALARVQTLLVHGADPERAAADGQTALGLALTMSRHDLAQWLRWGPWRLPLRPLRAADLPAAAAFGDLEAVRKLCALGLPANSTDALGCTALLRAAGGGHAALVECLLAQGADPAIGSTAGATALSVAVSAGCDAIVTRLIAAGAQVDQPIADGITPLMLAAALGRDSIVAALLLRGARPGCSDRHGASALHAAVQFAWASAGEQPAHSIITRLLDAGADVNARDQDGASALLLLLGGRVDAGLPAANPGLPVLVQRLLLRGADGDIQDRRGVSPLHAAAMHGLIEITELLLTHGVDPRRRDALGRNAYDVAVLLGYVDLAARLK
ncbi:MAG: ankyrin repeat domain-containing protein [Lysobacterales bacterium]